MKRPAPDLQSMVIASFAGLCVRAMASGCMAAQMDIARALSRTSSAGMAFSLPGPLLPLYGPRPPSHRLFERSATKSGSCQLISARFRQPA